MSPETTSPAHLNTFITRWAKAEAAERANYVLFLSELCDLLGVPRPDPAGADTETNAYVFERAVTFHHRGSTKTSTGRIDLYKRDCFVCECKQYAHAKKTEPAELSFDLTDDARKSPKIARGSAAWDRAMLEAHSQAEDYATRLPTNENPPPFLLVVDVGHVIELFADFTQRGKAYLPFPDARSHRIKLTDLANPDLRERLRQVWTTPAALDPSKRAAAVTREVADYLSELAKSFEKRHEPKLVAEFLSRCLFCMFAEDVGLLPKNAFGDLLESVKADTGAFVPMMELLFEDMNQGRFSGLLKKKLLYFNGGLFASAKALPVTTAQLALLRKAAALEWRHVEPAIFGTLLERALSPEERHKLGAHYTPVAYVERLVLQTVIKPLRDEWDAVRIAAVTLAQRGDLKAAKNEVNKFHAQLCAVRVLDPACGSGNFLYVALEQMKRLEGEVINLLRDLGDDTDFLKLQGATVDPHQFLGIEINERAAALAELVLWIGYLQWHFRVHGETSPAEPVLRKFNNIECRDAVLAYDKKEFAKGPDGKTLFVWDRRTFKVDPVTGRDIPNEQAVAPVEVYIKPRPAVWPQADFIVGNPPFLGSKRMRADLGDGYVDALQFAWPEVPQATDFVMRWWHSAAQLISTKKVRRFGFITTNSFSQTYVRRAVDPHLTTEGGVSIVYAIPDHPWVDSADGAAVRIAMTVAETGRHVGKLDTVVKERTTESGELDVDLSRSEGMIQSDLSIGSDVAGAVSLQSNDGICSVGMKTIGDAFQINREVALALGLKKHDGIACHIRKYLNGRDLFSVPRGIYIIDFFGLEETDVRNRFPEAYEHLLKLAKPDRLQNRNNLFKKTWWVIGHPRQQLRSAIRGLKRYIATVETSKHRIFTYVDISITPDSTIVAFGMDDGFLLGVLSSSVHVVFSLAAGGHLGVGNDPRYNKTRCFDPFPFPDCTETQKARIRALAEELDAHRKRAQATHGLGLTDIYNVLEKVRAGSTLTTKDKALHDAALVSTLKQLHDGLDAAVADAYGWTWPLTDAEILEKTVNLNTARAAEEAKGHIRWLRPDYQKPLFAGTKQAQLGLTDAKPAAKGKVAKPAKAKKVAWPKTLAERAKAVETALTAAARPITAAELTKQFTRSKETEVLEILETLVALARAHAGDSEGTFVR